MGVKGEDKQTTYRDIRSALAGGVAKLDSISRKSQRVNLEKVLKIIEKRVPSNDQDDTYKIETQKSRYERIISKIPGQLTPNLQVELVGAFSDRVYDKTKVVTPYDADRILRLTERDLVEEETAKVLAPIHDMFYDLGQFTNDEERTEIELARFLSVRMTANGFNDFKSAYDLIGPEPRSSGVLLVAQSRFQRLLRGYCKEPIRTILKGSFRGIDDRGSEEALLYLAAFYLA